MNTRTTPAGSPISRRKLLTVLLATPLVASFVAACGSDADEGSGSPDSDPTTPTQPVGAITFPTGAGEVVVRIDTAVGGFNPPEWAFAQIPSSVVSGDGRTVMPGPQIEIYPPPLLPALQSTSLTEAQVGQLLARADSLGLLATPPDYESTQPPVADAGSTVVTFNANGATYVHSAPSLGLEQQPDEARQRLSDFVEFATSFVAERAATESEVFEPESYVIGTMAVNTAEYADDVAPTVVPWPAAFGVAPVGEDCATIDGAAVRSELATANQLTFFVLPTQDDTAEMVVRLLLRPSLPGSTDC
jgi:hypothetical protein